MIISLQERDFFPDISCYLLTYFLLIYFFSLGGLFPNFRPCDDTPESSCFQILK